MNLASAKSIEVDDPNPARERILRAATELFASKGFDGVTIRELAHAAAVTQPLIYHYFGDKRGAYRAAVSAVFSAKAEQGRAVMGAFSDPADQVYAFVGWLVDSFLNDEAYARLMHHETIDNPSHVSRELTSQMCPPDYRQLEELMRRLSPKEDAAEVAASLYAVTLGFTMFRPFVRGGRLPGLESADAVVHRILRLVFPHRSDLHRKRTPVRRVLNSIVGSIET